MKKESLTPEQLNEIVAQKEKQICTELTSFIVRNKINKSTLAATMGIHQQNISRILDWRNGSKLGTLLLMQAALEELTGIPFEVPRFTRPTSPAVNKS